MIRRRGAGLVLASVALCGCADARIRGYPPLERMQSNPLIPRGMATTIGSVVFVKDVGQWERSHPEPFRDAVLAHEQVHSVRQRAAGLGAWLSRYLVDTDFALHEEALGWAVWVKTLRAAGLRVDLDSVAGTLAAYPTVRGSKRRALKALKSALQGQ